MQVKQNPRFKEVPKEQADGLAWAFDNKNADPRQYYFKFAQLGPNEVRIRVLYSAICRTDITMVRKGYLGDSQPITPGHQIVGRVQAIGSNVGARRVGDIVGVGYNKGSCNQCKLCLTGFDQVCFGHKNSRTIYPDIGGFSTHIHAAQDWTFQIPNNLDISKAPPLMCAGITVFNALQSKCKKDDKVAIIGIGGLGHIGIMMAHKMGYNITAFSSSDKKQEEAKKFGADNYVVSTNDNLQKHQGLYDVVILTTSASPDDFQKCWKLTKLAGKICVATVMDPAPQVSFGTMIHDQRQYHAIRIGSKRQFIEMLKFCADTDIESQCEAYDFMDFKKAFARTEHQNPKYRVVLKIDQNLMKK